MRANDVRSAQLPPLHLSGGGYWDVTQPSRRGEEYGPVARQGRSRAGSCLSPFALAVLVTLLSCGCLFLAGIGVLQWTGGRTNVLILGLDRRPNQGLTVRSDVVMLVTAYPQGPRLALLSIPRDLYIKIPRYGDHRINTAHFWGEREGAGGGPGLAMETVAHNFGVPVNHYVRVDFEGFRAVVDAVGGVDIVVDRAIVDSAYPTDDYGTTRIEIPAGPQRMDGERALQYVRTRRGASDFERAARQQQVLKALMRQMMRPANWPRLPAAFWAVTEHLETNLGPVEMVRLSVTALMVGEDGMEHHVIDRDMTRPWTTPTGGAVLLPRWEMIDPLVEDLFTP